MSFSPEFVEPREPPGHLGVYGVLGATKAYGKDSHYEKRAGEEERVIREIATALLFDLSTYFSHLPRPGCFCLWLFGL